MECGGLFLCVRWGAELIRAGCFWWESNFSDGAMVGETEEFSKVSDAAGSAYCEVREQMFCFAQKPT